MKKNIIISVVFLLSFYLIIYPFTLYDVFKSKWYTTPLYPNYIAAVVAIGFNLSKIPLSYRLLNIILLMIVPSVFLIIGEAFTRREPATIIYELTRINDSNAWIGWYSLILISLLGFIMIFIMIFRGSYVD